MHLEEGKVYHVFNRGNNKQRIFPEIRNYSYFLTGIEKYIQPVADILAYCLMPNHFHLLVYANARSTEWIEDDSFRRQRFSQGIKQLLSSYTKAINKQEGRVGSLFQQKTKALCATDSKGHHSRTVFHYIHQNPMRSGLVTKMEHWDFSSFRDYLRLTDRHICDTLLATELLEINFSRFYEESYEQVGGAFSDFE